jgi:ubiquitin carboxyl-terminal hydrolase 5/13
MKAWENQIIQCEHTITLAQSQNAPKLEKKCKSNQISNFKNQISKNKSHFLALAHCSDCELNANLWLCLTCGHLGCGRKNYDGTGGNGHALVHADTTKHHVVCKLGTISPEGTAGNTFCEISLKFQIFIATLAMKCDLIHF